jgi:hypothetical protein
VNNLGADVAQMRRTRRADSGEMVKLEDGRMKTCRHCNSVESDNTYVCSVCQRALLPAGPSRRTLQKTALTVAIPIVVWVVMTRLLG